MIVGKVESLLMGFWLWSREVELVDFLPQMQKNLIFGEICSLFSE